MIDRNEIIAILEEHLFVSDEWGGSKLASWKWGFNVVVDGIDDAADEILRLQLGVENDSIKES